MGFWRRRGPEMCTFGVLGLQPESSKRAHFRARALTPPIPRKDPHEREERKKIVAGEGKKRATFSAVRRRALRRTGAPAEGVRVGVVRGRVVRVEVVRVGVVRVEAVRGWGPEGWEPKPGKVGPRRVGHRRVGPRRVGMKVVLG